MLHGAGGTGGLPPCPCLHPVVVMLHGAGGMGGLPPSPCLHPVVDTFLFLCQSVLFLCCPPLFLMLHGAGGTGGLLPCPSLHPVVDTFLFYANLRLICPFLMLSPSFSYASWRRWDGGSPSMSISPSCLSTRFFFYANLSFSYAVPLFFLCSTARVGRAPLYKTRPFLVLSFMRSWFFLCCVCPFLMLHGALSIYLHVSPSISMSPSCCRHVCFLMPTGLSLMRAVSPFMPSVFFC